MAAQRRTTAAAAPKPQSQAVGYAQRKQREQLTRLGALLGVLAIFIVPRLPSPLFGFDWKGPLWQPFAPMLLASFPNDPTLPAWINAPTLIWLYRALAGVGVWFIFMLIQHLQSLYAQRTAPLSQSRSYISLAVPLSINTKPEEGIGLIRTLHGVLPPANLKLGSGAPLVLRWIGMPEQPIKQGVSVLGPMDFIVSIQKTLEGLGKGTEADVVDDPLLKELKPNRYLCWADARLQAADDLPIAIPSGPSPLQDALLPALSPQAGVVLADVQLILRPVPDRSWRTAVLARLESLKIDAGAIERRVMEQKAAGPAFEVAIRLIVIAEKPEAGEQMVKTMGNALASSAQGIATAQQRLVCGPVQVLPTVIEPPPFPKPQRLAGFIAGVVVAVISLALIILLHLGNRGLQLWFLPLCVLPLPVLAMAARWRKQAGVAALLRLLTVAQSVMEPTNPNIVPIWSQWLGRNG
jgi:hypothetical protein